MSDNVNHEKRWMWLMLLVSVAIHAVLGIVASHAPSRTEPTESNRRITIVSVRSGPTTAPATSDNSAEPGPLEPVPQATEIRPTELAPERVSIPDEPPIEPRPSAQNQMTRERIGEPEPSMKSLKPLPRQQLVTSANAPTTVDEVPALPAPSTDNRNSVSSGSRGTRNTTNSVGGRANAAGNRVSPRYPRELWEREIGGNVDVLASVDADGHVVAVKVSKTSGYTAFDEAALEAVRRWRDLPPGQDVIVPIVFRIRR